MAKKTRKKKSKPERKLPKKNIFNKVLLGSFFGIFIIGLYISADMIENYLANSFDSFLRMAGFRVELIRVIGTKNKELEETIKKEISIAKGDNIFKLSTNSIYQKIIKIPSIKTAAVRKNLPNSLNVAVTEKVPIAIFQKDSKFYLMDKEGAIISEVTSRIGAFPIVAGDESNINANLLLEAISKFPVVAQKLDSMMFVRKRRWDIIVAGGINVKLPQDNFDRVLRILSILLEQNNINKHTVKSIDLRVPENIIIKGLKLKKSKDKNVKPV